MTRVREVALAAAAPARVAGRRASGGAGTRPAARVRAVCAAKQWLSQRQANGEFEAARPCKVCKKPTPKSGFSKTQWKRRGKCKECAN